MLKISLIPYSCGAGAANQACKDGPEYLQKIGFKQILESCGLNVDWLEGNLENCADSDIDNVISHCKYLKYQVQNVIKEGGFPITIGGDHSMAVGTWSGVTKSISEKLGLIWVDAHMDAHTSKTSHTGNKHGMPVSYLLGYGRDDLAFLCDNKPVIDPENLCLIGVRSFEKEEHQFLTSQGVRIFYMEEIRQKGLDNVMQEAVKIVSNNTAKFGISIDIDAFDPQIAPGTGTLAPGGILKEEFINSIENNIVNQRDMLVALEIAEYNPRLDKNDITAKLIADISVVLLK